jgi:hypothetical protein
MVLANPTDVGSAKKPAVEGVEIRNAANQMLPAWLSPDLTQNRIYKRPLVQTILSYCPIQRPPRANTRDTQKQ